MLTTFGRGCFDAAVVDAAPGGPQRSSSESDGGGSLSSGSDDSESDGCGSDGSDVAPVPGVADVFRSPSRDQCVAAYAVRVVTPRGPVKGELRVAPRSLYFVAGESAAELKKGENAPERWRLDGLTAVRGRRYLLRPLALEFFFATRREVFVAFESPQDRRVCWRLMKLKARMPLVAHPPGGTKTMRAPHLELHAIRLTERWRRRLVTNFEYVMALNTIAGRSYNDLAQYFVFPWIIADYGGATAVPGELRAALGMEPAAAPREPGARAPRPARDAHTYIAPLISPTELAVVLGDADWLPEDAPFYSCDLGDVAVSEEREAAAADDDDAPTFDLSAGHAGDAFADRRVSLAYDDDDDAETAVVAWKSAAADFLNARDWRGLEVARGETPVRPAVEGRTGVASGYAQEERDEGGS
ncbi:hypothetical protein AURANDRAFT_61576 [Aureococcus anophagefferens]|uniref:BEACH domain-containing protein n=1 Tax=Aureococcus anophagefferens TaxID=44056 RepID=F0Y0K6_AURAN|nr:hypothetical protein AURANDRAFT_61576 [Aureococcus anophagefferens]EGB11731.1 hypothetical protein AURANDRAFT_61576 [Aureococcus anophagefferens]|eukprot:XP_009034069.1 hypothetical protein AURANDRAFT_61576 [Aureococcus anophagefferens]